MGTTIAVAMSSAAVTVDRALAQTTSKTKGKGSPTNDVKRLDARVDELRETFLRETHSLIRAYEEAGQPDRARSLLESLGRLDPKNEAIKQKLEQLRTEILDAGESELEIDVGKPWQPVGPVRKDETLRIKVAGDYKCTLTISAGPEGVPTGNPVDDLVGHVPFGAVMGVIAPAGEPQQDAKPPKPFAVGESYEKSIDKDGMLFLKVNLPPGSKATGRLKVRVSGAARP